MFTSKLKTSLEPALGNLVLIALSSDEGSDEPAPDPSWPTYTTMIVKFDL